MSSNSFANFYSVVKVGGGDSGRPVEVDILLPPGFEARISSTFINPESGLFLLLEDFFLVFLAVFVVNGVSFLAD